MSDAIAHLDWADLYSQFAARIQQYIFRRTSDYHLAEDLTADVFTRAIERYGNGGEVASFSGWLFRIAHNIVIDHYRARGRRADVELAEGLRCPAPTPHEQVESALDGEQLYCAIDRLTPEQRIVIARRMEGYEFDEIAAELGKREGAVKALLQRGLVQLHAHLSDYMGTPAAREVHRVSCAQDICALLRERGPMTKREIANKLCLTPSTVHWAIQSHGHLFVAVGTTLNKRGRDTTVWGVRELPVGE